MRGFTLIEMLLVIVIIGILMLMVFRFGGDRLQLLQMQTTKESIMTFWEDVLNNNRTSSYILDQQYSTLGLTFNAGTSQMTADYYSATGAVIHSELSKIFPNMKWTILAPSATLATVTLLYAPYVLGCTITDQVQSYDTMLLQLSSTSHPQTYCFAIQAQTCMLQELSCPEI